ncbi:pre-60S factor rei1 [Malassezia yamatoensis]|uniref:Pre-60S factor rei1 n=1 Tax=Malassezia yamatoensis TaxID=253288 RepID=A0AAJ6CHK0_9BASI|nr:pre-60S factor rei1 [Malassezia yamatoensis]
MNGTHGGSNHAGDDDQHVFTCVTCSVAFISPSEQRDHFRTDLHRYNMKRRVANLAPVSASVFNEKVQERRAALEVASKEPENTGKCITCSKTFSSENAYRDHMQSKKHKEKASRVSQKPAGGPTQASSNVSDVGAAEKSTDGIHSMASMQQALHDADQQEENQAVDSGEEALLERAIEKKLARARRIDPGSECMFCSQPQSSLETSLNHMKKSHGFFVPERNYLVDQDGFLQYLADKVAVGNVCLWCNGRGRGFYDVRAVQKHMLDKSHCKLAYDTQQDQLEYADFYDFRPSYPDYQRKQQEAAEWEDVSDDESGENLDEDNEHVQWQQDDDHDNDSDSSDESLPENGIRYGDSELELVLPSGARLGHRSLQRYYRQSLWQTPAAQAQPATAANGRALAHRLAGSDRIVRGDHVVSDRGGNQLVARNRGEAKEAQRHIKEFRDVQRREQFKTKVGFRNNNQKHFRDPLLQ